jgi:integrase/recombinase XerC
MKPENSFVNNSFSKFSNNNDLIQEFSLIDKAFKSKKKAFWLNVLEDFFLFHGKDFYEISEDECLNYLGYLERVHMYRYFSEKTLKPKIQLVFRFIKFLEKRKIGNVSSEFILEKFQVSHLLIKLKRNLNKKTYTKKVVEMPEIIEQFLLYIDKKHYSQPDKYKYKILLFQRFLETDGINIELFSQEKNDKLLFDKVKRYEEMLTKRILLEEIQTVTATGYLRAIQVFIKFLYSRELVSMKYTIPLHLRGRSTRANEYVPKEGIISLINAIYENSNHVERDLAIFLIIVDTGCRPIEITNLSLKDIDTLERTISFECGKTEKRKVKISTEVMGVIKDYLSVRNHYVPITNQLFSNRSGSPIKSNNIGAIFYHANLRAFGEQKYSPKAFRHTYITNALQEHGFERVSKAIGHKDWKSTYYYYARSSKRLLKNTLGSSPLT